MSFYYSSMQNVNTGKEWSEMDIYDLRDLAPVMTLTETSDYLCSSEEEVVAKLEELKLPSRDERP